MNTDYLDYGIDYKDIIQLHGYDWKAMALDKSIPQDFVDRYFFKLKPFCIQGVRTLSPYFMLKYGDNLNWKTMSRTQDIPQFLMRKYADRLNWWDASQYQKMNIAFMKDYADRIVPQRLAYNILIDERTKKIFDEIRPRKDTVRQPS